MVKSTDLRCFETTYTLGDSTLSTALIYSQSGITPLEWRILLHPDGSFHVSECFCDEAEIVNVSVGQKLTRGEWFWKGLPAGLNGVKTENM